MKLSVPKLERLIILVFVVVSVCLAGYYGWMSYANVFDGGEKIDIVIPSALGIVAGQTVVKAKALTSTAAGSVESMRPVSRGVLVTIKLERGIFLDRDARVMIRAVSPLRPPIIEIEKVSDNDNREKGLALPALVPVEIELDPPDAMIEPAPKWPMTLSRDSSVPPGMLGPSIAGESGVGGFDKAQMEIRRARRKVWLSPSDPLSRLLLAEALWRNLQPGEAMSVLRPAMDTLRPGEMKAKILAGYGTAALSLGLLNDAVTSLSEAYDWFSDRGDSATTGVIAFNLAIVMRRSGLPEKAVSLLNEHDLKNLEANLIRASALADLERNSEATEILSAAAALSPVATLNYGILLRKNGLYNESITTLRHLGETWNDEALVKYYLAKSLEGTDEKPEASAKFMEASKLEKDPSLAEVFRKEAARLARSH